MRALSGVIVGLAVVLSGCGANDGESETTGAGDTTTEATTASSPEETIALVGTWRTDPITLADQVKTLRDEGLGDSVHGFEQNAPITDIPTSLILDIGNDGTWDLYGRPEGEQRGEIDYDARYEVDGDTVAVSHEGDANTYRWSVDGEILELAWLKTTYPDYKGIPEEVFQTALYMTSEFHRAP